MILDKLHELCSDTALAAVNATTQTLVGSEVDLGSSVSQDPSGMTLVLTVKTAIENSTTTIFTIFHEAAASVATSDPVLMVSAAIADATLVAGYTVFRLPIPAGCMRYLRASVYCAGDVDAGAIDCYVLKDAQSNQSTYPS